MSKLSYATNESQLPPLKVRGSLIHKQDIVAGSVDVFGHLKAKGNVVAASLKVSGECSIGRLCQAGRINNVGSLRVDSLQCNSIKSSGFLSVAREAAAGSFQAQGAVRINRLVAENLIEIRLSNRSTIGDMKAGGPITIRPSSMLLNLLMRPFCKLHCRTIEGTAVTLYRTKADLVCGEDVTVGPGCTIREIRYSRNLKITPGSQVERAELLKE